MKQTASPFLLFLLALVSLNAFAQKPVPTPTPQPSVQPADETDVIRITTNLVQVDAVVTDKNGKAVTNLKPEDFKILVNGKPQQITNFSLITLEPPPIEQPVAAAKNTNKNAVPIPPARLRPEQIKRTIALVFDDLTLPFDSIRSIRQSIRKFVDEQVQPDDLVAIIRTGTGIGTLQQFTSDKQQLYAAIDHLTYNPDAAALSVSEPANESNKSIERKDRDIKSREADEFRADLLANASIAATRYVVQGMSGLPGRKAVMFISGGFPLYSLEDPSYYERVRVAIERLIDSANRAGVVIYTMDGRGLVDGATAADSVSIGMTSEQISLMMDARMRRIIDPQASLINIAKQAGGFAVYNTNDYSSGIKKALDDQKSYYLIGYQPDASIFDPTRNRFNNMTVKVKGSGLTVRYRSGFFGIKDEENKVVVNTPQQQIMKALTSPFAAGNINLRLTPLFGNDATAGSYVRALIHISAKDLTFTDKPDSSHEAIINIVAYTFGDNGTVADSTGETHTITLSDKLYQRALSSGVVYSLIVPIKNAGGYQLRVAVRDDKSEKIGTASQFINVPEIKKDRLVLSGIALTSYDPREEKNRANDANKQSTAETSGDALLTQAALRRFRTGHVLQFAYTIFNAKSGNDSTPPQLTMQFKLYREGKEIFAGKETPYSLSGQPDLDHLVVEGALQLGGLTEGNYVLQAIVTDTLAKGKYRTTTNWTDFEVVK